MSEDRSGNPQASVTSSEVNRITQHTFKGKQSVVPNCGQSGYRRHDPGEKCPGREIILNVYMNQVLHLNQEEVNTVHTEKCQLSNKNSEGSSQQNLVERKRSTVKMFNNQLEST